MSSRNILVAVAAAALTSALLIVPTAGVAAHDGWHNVQRNDERQIEGSGRLATENRSIGNFRGIELNGIGDVQVRLGARPSLQITADDNLLPYFTTRVEGDTLVLDSRGSFRTRNSPRIVVTVPDLNSVAIRGSGDVRLVGVDNAALSLVIHGSGDIVAQGRTRDLTVRILGSGETDVRALRSAAADVRVQGSGDIHVATNGALDAKVSGSGTIYYAGNPRPLNIRRSGTGEIIAVP